MKNASDPVPSRDPVPSPAQGATALGRALAVAIPGVVAVLTLLVVVAFEPGLPGTDLDAAWPYGLDAAAALGMPFGRAVVFTFGPLVSLYTSFYVPAHDLFYLVAASVLALGLTLGFLLAADRGRWPFLLLLPFALANLTTPDAMFFVLPLCLVLGCARGARPGPARSAGLVALAAVAGMLPLVKGTMSIPLAVCTLVAAGLLARRRMPVLAAMLPLAVVASTLATWRSAGQDLSDLPTYFARQAAVAAGYTDAMSSGGDLREILVYLVAALVVAGGVAARIGWMQAVACACVAFVALKAGFVRHDGHAVIAATTLALIGYLVFLHERSRLAVAVFAVALAGWAFIASHYLPIGPGADLRRFADEISRSSRAIAGRLTQPGEVFAAFAGEKERIRTETALPRLAGSSDIYPVGLSALIASDLDWNPRPVIQSYSAYTPELAALNAAHLRGEAAPQHLFFDVDPIDGRYPSLEDGASWPAILGRYRLRGLAKTFAVLDRADGREAAIGAPLVARAVPFDTDIPVPAGVENVWARLAFQPPALGRLLSALFKLPRVLIELTYVTGAKATFRMIPGMAAGGFLLSPTVSSVAQFLALKSGDPAESRDRHVVSFRLHQGGPPSFPAWGSAVDVVLASLSIERDPSVDRTLFGTRVLGPAIAAVPEGGGCAIDMVAGHAVDGPAIPIATDSAFVQGWGMISSADQVPSTGLRVALVAPDGGTIYSAATRTERPDVTHELHVDEHMPVGFEATVDLRDLHGRFQIRIVQDGPDGAVDCPQTADIVH